MRTAVTAAFITALLDGRIVARAHLEEMMQTVEMPDGDGLLDYGLGLMKASLPCGVTDLRGDVMAAIYCPG